MATSDRVLSSPGWQFCVYTVESRLTGYRRFSEENLPKLLKLVERIGEIGKRHNATPGQVALAWILAQGDKIIPIPGTKRVKVRHNLTFVNVHKLIDVVEISIWRRILGL